MAKKPRVHFPGAFYHIITRLNRRQKILLNELGLSTLFELLAGMKTVAEQVNRDPVVMSQGITKVKQKLMPDEAVQQTITTLEEVLTRNRKKRILNN